MAKSDIFRKQHQDLLGMVGSLSTLLNSASIASKSTEIRNLMTKMKGAVEMHLSVEELTMYQQMLANASGKGIAEKFKKEMGGISSVFMGYMSKYSTPAIIETNASAFITETNGLIKALGDRIKREETELYPIFDKM